MTAQRIRRVRAWHLVFALVGTCRCDKEQVVTPAPSASIITADPVEVPGALPDAPIDSGARDATPDAEANRGARPSTEGGPCRCPPADPLCTCL